MKRRKVLSDVPKEGLQLLESYLEAGTVWWDGESRGYVGTASDGEVVDFGYDKLGVGRYLQSRPSPSDW